MEQFDPVGLKKSFYISKQLKNDFEMKDKTSRFVADKALKVRYIIEEDK